MPLLPSLLYSDPPAPYSLDYLEMEFSDVAPSSQLSLQWAHTLPTERVGKEEDLYVGRERKHRAPDIRRGQPGRRRRRVGRHGAEY